MTPEEYCAMKERLAKADVAQAAVDRAKKALEEAEKLTPETVAREGVCRSVIMFDSYSPGRHLLVQAAEMHAQPFIEAIKGQLRAHLKVQEEKLANA